MSSNLPLGAEYDPNAPWLQEDAETCPECGAEMEVTDSGRYRRVNWDNYKCPECGREVINEPDPDEEYDSRYD